jgi:hypothetical protein
MPWLFCSCGAEWKVFVYSKLLIANSLSFYILKKIHGKYWEIQMELNTFGLLFRFPGVIPGYSKTRIHFKIRELTGSGQSNPHTQPKTPDLIL